MWPRKAGHPADDEDAAGGRRLRFATGGTRNFDRWRGDAGPVSAVFPEDSFPNEWQKYIATNYEYCAERSHLPWREAHLTSSTEHGDRTPTL